MVVQCLGSGNAFSAGGRFNTAFFIRTSRGGILLDCGATTLAALKKAGRSMEDIDLIVITHFHGDHFGGLPFILCEILALRVRQKLLTVVGPEGVEEKTKQALHLFFPGITIKSDSPIRFMPYRDKQTVEVNNIAITAYPVVHSPETNPHAVRIAADNKVIAYSGDTEWTDVLTEVSKGADLFICEGSGYNTASAHHLSIKELVQNRHRFDAKRMVLTHLGEEALKHSDAIPFPVVHDGAILLDENQATAGLTTYDL
jgi:ribonuclease BN (tRNA processing enzyme)